MSVIDTLIFDRTEADVERVKTLALKGVDGMSAAELTEWIAGMRGSYNATDLNRVGQAINYIAAELATYDISVTVNPKTDWAVTDIPTAAQLTAYLAEVSTIRSALPTPSNVPAVPNDMEYLTYQKANDIEQILYEIDLLVQNMIAVFVRSGVWNSDAAFYIKDCGQRFQRVAYLISTKGITITGTKLTNNSEIQARVYRPSGAVAQYIYQADSGSALTTNFTAYTSAGGSATGYWRFGSTYAALAVSTGSWHETKQNKSGIWIDGSKVATYSSVSAFTTVNSLTIHGTAASANMRIAWLERYENGVYAASYWPVKDLVTNKYGYLDTSDGSFWTNDDATITAGGNI